MYKKKDIYAMDNYGYEEPEKEEIQEEPINNIKINLEEIKEERASWGNKLEFLMSCIALSVGLGNIWRFPFTAYENGGGAFVIPYVIVLLIIGRPMYYMEMYMGQFSSRGTVKLFEALAPAAKGVAYAQIFGTICVATYYCSLAGTTIFYLVNSFTSNLPWEDCWPEWNIELAAQNLTCVPSKSSDIDIHGSITSSELYYTKEVLKKKTDINDGIGLPDWRLTLCLFSAWLLNFFVSFKGIKSSGKASYFLALFPYAVILALLLRAVTLEGSTDGIWFFIKPDWHKLYSVEVWYAAVTQCFYSLTVGFGSITMYSSYNKFDHNINRDAMIVTTLDTITSMLAGITIFGVLGNLAHKLKVDIGDVVKTGGDGLAFISYPDAISKFDYVPWVFAILFFSMLIVLSIGSLTALQVNVITVIMDVFPKVKKWQLSAAISTCGFLIGLVYVTPGGPFILNLVDFFAGTFVIFLAAIFEIVVVMWCYGLENVCIDLEFMTGNKVHIYWRIMWAIITPVMLIVIFFYFLLTFKPLTYNKIPYPTSAMVCGWMILGVTAAQAFMWIFYYLHVNRNFKSQIISKAFSSENWGPLNLERFKTYKIFKHERKSELDKRYTSKVQRVIGVLFK